MHLYWANVNVADVKLTMWGWAESQEHALALVVEAFPADQGFTNHIVAELTGYPPENWVASFGKQPSMQSES
jgi:hypothetical protein